MNLKRSTLTLHNNIRVLFLKRQYLICNEQYVITILTILKSFVTLLVTMVFSIKFFFSKVCYVYLVNFNDYEYFEFPFICFVFLCK
jgi:hypothetical protein